MTTKYELRVTGEFKQNLKLCQKRGLPMNELCESSVRCF